MKGLILNHPPGFKLGILGGGQLARMLALASYPLGILPYIFAKNQTEPATQVSPYLFLGDVNDHNSLKNFLKNCDVVTFESEFLDAKLLDTLSKELNVRIYPSPSLMGQLQDRLTQKQILFKYKIPTAPYLEINTWADFQKIKNLSSQIVMKQRRFGYDGYGTFFIQASSDKSVWDEIQAKSPYGFIAESKIHFKRELALILARDQQGQVIDFPLVESKQTHARCDWVIGPVKHKKETQLRNKLKLFLKKIDYIGVIAFELFDTGKELLVNEIAPRVHNSGHYSLDALTLSQFQAHVMAVAGFKLPKPKLLSPFAMTNLLGLTSTGPYWNADWFNKNQNSHLHWYGKIENRKDRKMGHINTLDSKPQNALKKSLLARRKVSL